MFKELFTKAEKPLITKNEYDNARLIALVYQSQNNIPALKRIPGFNGAYLASNLGYVFSDYFKTRKKLSPISKNGIKYVNIALGGRKRKQLRLDYLIAITFIPNPDKCEKVIHIDGDPSNCNLLNLKWQ